MGRTRKFVSIVLVVLLAATIYGLIRTGEGQSVLPTRKSRVTPVTQAPLVDQAAFKTAQQLAQRPATVEERPFAEEALRLADYGLDLAFAQALRDAKEHPPELSAEAKEIQARLQKSEKLLAEDKARVEQLDEAMDKASEEKKAAIDDELDLVKAQVELDQDEVEDAKQDLVRAGGDPAGRIQAMVQEHESLGHAGSNSVGAVPEAAGLGLVRQGQRWWALHQKQMALWGAKQEAETRAAALTAKHNQLDAQVDAQKASSPELEHHSKKVKGREQLNSASGERTKEQSEELLDKTQRIAAAQKKLAGFDKRVDTEKELADVYAQWIAVVARQQRAVLHGVLIGVTIILGIGLVGFYFDNWLEKLLERTKLDRRQVETLRTVVRVGVQVTAVLLILLVIMGPPGQLGTFLGLAGAGLTVALKDFIVGFLGWFVLMGKNGIRLGDWVEINGVTGEVVELGMFHTVLLETGNWTDSGHPTGRRVTFTNGFAIEGHYFNFSTSGQWLWDELHVVLPPGRDLYPMVDAIQKQVQEATQESAKQAESEWRRAIGSREMSSFSVAPAISVKPVVGGIEVAVRYITKANERYQLRSKLYQSIVTMLGGRGQAVMPSPEPPRAPAD
jgi:small-conductance mechanosensitive channel